MNIQSKPMCGLWHANVVVSPYNDNGECPCLECFGMHCRDCNVYQAKVAEIADIVRPTNCQKCQRYELQKTR